MHKIVRSKTFETNSSSTHSLTISDGVDFDEMLQTEGSYIVDNRTIDNVYILFQKGKYEFGWESETSSDIDSKLNYLYIYVRDWSGENRRKHLNILKNVLKDHCDIDNILVPLSTSRCDNYSENYNYPFYKIYLDESVSYDRDDNREYDCIGYIDHQSVECRDLDYLFEDEEKLKSFLFSSKSYLMTDNDNY